MSGEGCGAVEHWTVAIMHELPDGSVAIRRWRLCPCTVTDQWLAAAAQLGEPEEEQLVTAEDVAIHRAAHAGDVTAGVTIRRDQ